MFFGLIITGVLTLLCLAIAGGRDLPPANQAGAMISALTFALFGLLISAVCPALVLLLVDMGRSLRAGSRSTGASS